MQLVLLVPDLIDIEPLLLDLRLLPLQQLPALETQCGLLSQMLDAPPVLRKLHLPRVLSDLRIQTLDLLLKVSTPLVQSLADLRQSRRWRCRLLPAPEQLPHQRAGF
jgi:hypothetical protein